MHKIADSSVKEGFSRNKELGVDSVIASNIQALRVCRYSTTWQVSTQLSGDGNENDNFASIWSATVRAFLEFGHLVEVVAWQHHRNYHELANAFPDLVHLKDTRNWDGKKWTPSWGSRGGKLCHGGAGGKQSRVGGGSGGGK